MIWLSSVYNLQLYKTVFRQSQPALCSLYYSCDRQLTLITPL